MVKRLSLLVLVLAFATPVFAQDYHQIEIAFGYANVGTDNLISGLAVDGRHSGFASHQAFNLNSWFAIENYFGYYGLGTDLNLGKTQLLTNVFGGRVNYRTAGPVLYAGASLGPSWLRFPDLGAGSNSSITFRYGGGVDIPIDESLAWKVDVSRMSFHFDGWKSGMNVSTGIVLKFSQF